MRKLHAWFRLFALRPGFVQLCVCSDWAHEIRVNVYTNHLLKLVFARVGRDSSSVCFVETGAALDGSKTVSTDCIENSILDGNETFPFLRGCVHPPTQARQTSMEHGKNF